MFLKNVAKLYRHVVEKSHVQCICMFFLNLTYSVYACFFLNLTYSVQACFSPLYVQISEARSQSVATFRHRNESQNKPHEGTILLFYVLANTA